MYSIIDGIYPKFNSDRTTEVNMSFPTRYGMSLIIIVIIIDEVSRVSCDLSDSM